MTALLFHNTVMEIEEIVNIKLLSMENLEVIEQHGESFKVLKVFQFINRAFFLLQKQHRHLYITIEEVPYASEKLGLEVGPPF